MATNSYLSGDATNLTPTGLAYFWKLVKDYADSLIGGYADSKEALEATADALPGTIVTGVSTSATPTSSGTLQLNVKVSTKEEDNCYGEAQSLTVTLPAATNSSAGVMTADQCSKLSKIEEDANNYTLPVATLEALGGIKIGYSGIYEALNLDSSSKAYVEISAISTDEIKKMF